MKPYSFLIWTCITLSLHAIAMPSAQAIIRGKLTESTLDKSKAAERETAFGPWMSATQLNKALLNAELARQELVMLEYDPEKYRGRAVLIKPNGRGAADNSYTLAASKQSVLEQHASKSLQGYRLIYLQENDRSDTYCAVWIHSRGYNAAGQHLSTLGVELPKIEITSGNEFSNSKPETKPKIDTTGKIDIQSPRRTWTSADGRSLEAALKGYNNGEILLQRATGAPFPYQLHKLSGDDQNFVNNLIAEAIAKANQPAPDSTMTSDGLLKMTDWLDSDEFETERTSKLADGYFIPFWEYDRRGRIRAMFAKKPGGMGWYYFGLGRSGLLEKHNTYLNSGYELLSLTYTKKIAQYQVVWVSKRHQAQLADLLEASGVSRATIKNGVITPSEYKEPK